MRARLYCVDSRAVNMVQVNEQLVYLNVCKAEEMLPCKWYTVEISELHHARWIEENVKIEGGVPTLPGCDVTVIDQGDGFESARPKEEET